MNSTYRKWRAWFKARPRRKKRLKYGLIALGILIVAAASARPVSHYIKRLQARRLANEANQAMDNRQWREASQKALDAVKLRPDEPAAMDTMVHLLSRTGQSAAALGWWKKIEQARPLTLSDRREYASAALDAGEVAIADGQIKLLLAEKTTTPEDLILAAQLDMLQGNSGGALQYAKRVAKNPNISPLTAFNSAVVTVGNSRPDSPAYGAAVDRLVDLARSENPAASLEALRLIAVEKPRPRLTNPGQPPLTLVPTRHQTKQISREENAALLDNHPNPNASPADKLLALQLRSEAQRIPVMDYTKSGVEKFNGDESAAPALAAWLYDHDQFEQLLEIVPLDRAAGSRSLYLWRVDALNALGRLPELKDMLLTEYSAIDQISQHIFLAIVSSKLGEDVTATNEWDRALESANTTRKFQLLEQFAEANGAFEIADKACIEILTRSPRLRTAYLARLRIAEAVGKTAEAQKFAAEIVRLWPDDEITRDRERYLRLLLGGSPGIYANTARELDQMAASRSLDWDERATLALAELRSGRPAAALTAVERNGTGTPPPPSVVAMRAKALAANGWNDKARQLAQKLVTARLLPEERAMIAPLLDSETPTAE